MPQHVTWVPWSEEDDLYLRKNAGSKPSHVLAFKLGRTKSAVEQRAAKLDISLCFGRTWVPVRQADIVKAAAVASKHIKYHGGKASAARELGIPYPRLQLLIKHAKKQGLL